MASLIGLLHIGAASLQTNEAGVAITGNNVANANNPGYVRRDLVIDEGRGPLWGTGSTGHALRSEDFVLSQKLARQQGDLLGRNQLAGGLRDIEQVLQAGQNDLSQKVADLGGAFSELTPAPQDLIRRGNAIEKGRLVAGEFNRVAQTLGQLQSQSKERAQGLLPQANDLARQIADLNRKIGSGTGGAIAPDEAGLAQNLDQRDQLAQQLSGLVGGQLLKNGDGTLDVLVGGLSLVHGQVAQELQLRDQPGAAPALLVGGQDVQVAVTGQLGGELLIMDSAAKTLAQFDRLAFDLASALNAQHAFGVGLDGVGARAFFEKPTQVQGAAINLKLDGALTPQTLAVGFTAQPGDNRNATALSNLIDQPVLEGGRSSFRNVYSRITSQIGADVQRVEGEAAAAKDQDAALQRAQQALQGVQTDEEMTRLLAYQRGFEASSRFIKAVDDMLARLTAAQ